MSVRDEINKFAKDEHKDALNWLFSKYHMQSQWSFVAKCTHESYGKFSYQTNRVWMPTDEGLVLYKNCNTRENERRRYKMNIVLVLNENNESEWVKMDKDGAWYIVYHYVNDEVERKCRYDDFFEAVDALKEWQSYFS